jgi:hypothetical protein
LIAIRERLRAERAEQAKERAELRTALKQQAYSLRADLLIAEANLKAEIHQIEGLLDLAEARLPVTEDQPKKPELWEFNLEKYFDKDVIYCTSPEAAVAIQSSLFLAALSYNSPEKKTVYIHNMNFDLQFILPTLHKLFDLKCMQVWRLGLLC